jgi:hypothetical protein
MNEFERAMRDLRRAERQRRAWAEWEQFTRDNQNTNSLKLEIEIVWLYPPEIFPHVHAQRTFRRFLKRPITLNSERRLVVGYSVLRAPAYHSPKTFLQCRFFYVFLCDLLPDKWLHEGFDMGIDPLTIAPTVNGDRTPRCFHAPTPEQRAAFEAILEAQWAKREAKRQQANERQRRHRAPEQKRRAHNARRRAQ